MALLGLREFEAALAKITVEADVVSREAVAQAAAIAEREAKANFVGAHKRGAPHTGGEQPNVVSGTARRSIVADPIRRYGLGDYSTIVAPRVAYARRLELGWPHSDGTPGHQVTRAFPFWKPAVDKAEKAYPALAERLWRRFLH